VAFEKLVRYSKTKYLRQLACFYMSSGVSGSTHKIIWIRGGIVTDITARESRLIQVD
jgi:hypothetical protein